MARAYQPTGHSLPPQHHAAHSRGAMPITNPHHHLPQHKLHLPPSNANGLRPTAVQSNRLSQLHLPISFHLINLIGLIV